MSRLEDLIQTLCPDGVEYKKVGQVCKFEKGKGLSKDAKGLGEIPIILYGELYTTYGNYITEVFSHSSEDLVNSSPTIHKGDLLLPISSTTKEAQIGKASVYLVDKPAYLGGDAIILRHEQNPGYLMYLLNSDWFEKSKMKCVFGTTINHLHPNKLSNIYIPLPPLPVQEEIVRILDTFTDTVAELEAELAARVRQYEYYRDFLLTFDKPATQSLADRQTDRQTDRQIRWVTLGEIATVMRGASPRPISQYIANDPNGVNWIKIGDVEVGSKYVTKSAEKITLEGASKSRKVENGDFILSNSMSFGRPYILGIDGCVHDGWIILSGFENSCTSDFLYYLLNTRLVQNYWKQRAAAGGSIQNLNSDIVKGTIIPIPSLEVQEQIVSILDRFDTLVNDLKNGLPAEIALRRKQYETYRDKLLTFTRRA